MTCLLVVVSDLRRFCYAVSVAQPVSESSDATLEAVTRSPLFPQHCARFVYLDETARSEHTGRFVVGVYYP